jgi:hypothetical protein
MAHDHVSSIDANCELQRDRWKPEQFLQALNCHSSLLRERQELC